MPEDRHFRQHGDRFDDVGFHMCTVYHTGGLRAASAGT